MNALVCLVLCSAGRSLNKDWRFLKGAFKDSHSVGPISHTERGIQDMQMAFNYALLLITPFFGLVYWLFLSCQKAPSQSI